MTSIQTIIDWLIEPARQYQSTTDILIKGKMDTDVKGIVTAFNLTQEVLEEAISIEANLIITHEGPFYSHENWKKAYECDPIFIKKLQLMGDADIHVFRFHDYFHRYYPDGIMTGLLHKLEWEKYTEENQAAATTLTIPKQSVAEIVKYVKDKLDAPFVRVVGDLSIECQRIGLLAGYRGGGNLVIPLFQEKKLDLIIAGEGPEWEAPEYVRDAIRQGEKKALMMIGHAISEEPGMEYLQLLLEAHFPHLPVSYIRTKPLFQVI